MSKMAPRKGSEVQPREVHRNIFKSFLLQNYLAQMLLILFVALPSSPLPSLFK